MTEIIRRSALVLTSLPSFIVKCLEAYYPESLNVMLIHNGASGADT